MIKGLNPQLAGGNQRSDIRDVLLHGAITIEKIRHVAAYAGFLLTAGTAGGICQHAGSSARLEGHRSLMGQSRRRWQYFLEPQPKAEVRTEPAIVCISAVCVDEEQVW